MSANHPGSRGRHRAREVALQILYRYDVAAHEPGGVVPKVGPELVADLNKHFDHFTVPPETREFAAQLVAGTLSDMASIDGLLETHASNWKITRMASVDRSLLRMAIYELTQIAEVPPSVVIDEAIELGKQFGTAETPAFVNGVLDAVKAAAGR